MKFGMACPAGKTLTYQYVAKVTYRRRTLRLKR